MTPLRAQGLASCTTSARRTACVSKSRSLNEPIENAGSRSSTHYAASTSQCTAVLVAQCRGVGRATTRRRVISQALFDPPPFRPEKLAVLLVAGTTPLEPAPPLSRKYTLTHNDITGSLRLTIGPDYNEQQISGFYTRLLRDEVVAEWVNVGSSGYALHVYCHVSGEERWLAPPLLRNYIFRREMPLVLDTLVYADRQLLRNQPALSQAQVYVHFQSSAKELDTVEYWGVLGDRSTWPKGPTSILLRMIYAVVGWPPSLAAQPADLSIDLPSELCDVEEAVRQQQRRLMLLEGQRRREQQQVEEEEGEEREEEHEPLTLAALEQRLQTQQQPVSHEVVPRRLQQQQQQEAAAEEDAADVLVAVAVANGGELPVPGQAAEVTERQRRAPGAEERQQQQQQPQGSGVVVATASSHRSTSERGTASEFDGLCGASLGGGSWGGGSSSSGGGGSGGGFGGELDMSTSIASANGLGAAGRGEAAEASNSTSNGRSGMSAATAGGDGACTSSSNSSSDGGLGSLSNGYIGNGNGAATALTDNGGMPPSPLAVMPAAAAAAASGCAGIEAAGSAPCSGGPGCPCGSAHRPPYSDALVVGTGDRLGTSDGAAAEGRGGLTAQQQQQQQRAGSPWRPVDLAQGTHLDPAAHDLRGGGLAALPGRPAS